MSFDSLGRMLIFMGLIVVGIGVLLLIIGRVPGLGRLPGDIYIKREGFTFYFPLMSAIIISIVLSLLFNLFFRG